MVLLLLLLFVAVIELTDECPVGGAEQWPNGSGSRRPACKSMRPTIPTSPRRLPT